MEYLSVKQLIEAYPFLGTYGSLANQRSRGTGPPYYKIGAKGLHSKVVYCREDIELWLKGCLVCPVVKSDD